MTYRKIEERPGNNKTDGGATLAGANYVEESDTRGKGAPEMRISVHCGQKCKRVFN